MLSILRQFNWLDILALVIVIPIAYIAFKLGFTAEIFKLPGTLLGLYLAFHYYSLFAQTAEVWIPGKKLASTKSWHFFHLCCWRFWDMVLLCAYAYYPGIY